MSSKAESVLPSASRIRRRSESAAVGDGTAIQAVAVSPGAGRGAGWRR